MNLVSLLFGFSGRINRLQYWLGCIGAGFGGAMLFFLFALLTMPSGPVPETPAGAMQVISSMGFAFGLPFLLMGWVGLALQTKRFHDRGRSALWTLLPFLPVTMIMVNLIGNVTTGAPFEQVMSSLSLWFILLQGVNLFMFVDLGCMPGKNEPNKYGPPPGRGGGPVAHKPTVPGGPAGGLDGIPGMKTALGGVEGAMERAIADRARQAAEEAAASASGAAAHGPSGGLRAPASGSFGRKVTQ